MSLGTVVRGVASSLLKNVKAEGLLGNEALNTMSERMSSLQRTTLLEAVRIRWVQMRWKIRRIKKWPNYQWNPSYFILDSALSLLVLSNPQFRRDVNASELVKGLPDSLLSSLSLSTLEKANLSSVDQLQGRGWTRAQVYTLDSNIKIQIHYHSTHFSLISLFLSVVSFPSEEDFG